MADGFKIADAYVSVVADIDERSVESSAMTAGDRAGETIGRRASIRAARDYERDATGRFVPASERVGKSSGDSLGKGVGSKRGIFSRIGGLFGGDLASGIGGSIKSGASTVVGGLRGALLNPYVLGAMAVIGSGLAPALMAGISGGIILGAGAGVLGLGIMLNKENPAVQKEAKRLGDTFTKTFKKASAPMIRPIVGSLNMLSDFVSEDLGPVFTRIFKDISPSLQIFTSGLIKMVRAALPGFEALAKSAGPFLNAISGALPGLGDALGTFFGLISTAGPDAAVFWTDLIKFIGLFLIGMGKAISWTARGYGEFRNFFTSIPGWVSGAIGWFKDLWSSITGFISGVGSWFSNAGSSIGSFFSGLWSSISGFFGRIGSWFASLPGKFTGWLSSARSTITTWGSNVGNFFAALPGRIGSFLMSLPGTIKNAFLTALNGALFTVGYVIGSIMKFFIELPGRTRSALSSLGGFIASVFNTAKTNAINIATSLVTSVVNFFRTAPGKAKAALSSLWSSISGAFTSARTNASNTANGLVNSVITFFRGLPGKARSAISSLWSSMVGAFNSAVSSARSKASELVNGAVSYLRGLPGKARSAVSGIKSSIIGVFSGAGSWLYSAGMNILRGLANGIKASVGAAIGAAKSAVKSVVSGAKSALGISSPSKVFDREVGRWLLPGAVRGVKRTVPAARRAIGAAVRSLVPAPVSAPAGRVSTVTPAQPAGNVYQFAPGAIVLDASKLRSIEEVVNLISGMQRSARVTYAAGRG